MLAEQEQKQVYSWYVDEAIRQSSELLGLTADDVIQGGFSIYTAHSSCLSFAQKNFQTEIWPQTVTKQEAGNCLEPWKLNIGLQTTQVIGTCEQSM